jgi:hypothetical protein
MNVRKTEALSAIIVTEPVREPPGGRPVVDAWDRHLTLGYNHSFRVWQDRNKTPRSGPL